MKGNPISVKPLNVSGEMGLKKIVAALASAGIWQEKCTQLFARIHLAF